MKSKTILALIGTFILTLVGCNSGNKDSGGDDEQEGVQLEKDTATSYNFDLGSTNENGSMSYEIFVRSFYDSDGNGIGDLNGVKAKLSYLQEMGIKTVWLMPIMPSPSYHGYDVTDYYNINPDYGTLSDFDSLIEEANKVNIDIMIDMVFNHCSIKHQYFLDSYNDYITSNTSPTSKATWFNWSETSGDHIYNGHYYESKFDASMPDFNLDNEDVRNEIENIVKFWIERGVKGFRLDAVLYYYYGVTSQNTEFLTWLADTAHKYDENFYMVGECWAGNSVVNSYYNSHCDSFFRFDNSIGSDYSLINFAKGRGDGHGLVDYLVKHERLMRNRNSNGYSSYFLSNHDQDRVSKSLDETQNKVAANLYCLLPGTPFMYYGEEIQLVGKRNTGPDDLSDVKRRLPMIWSKTNKTGECIFPEKNRQDLNNTKQVELGVEDKKNEPFSLLNHYRYVINIRNKYPLLKHGVMSSMCKELETDEATVIAYKVAQGSDYIIVVHNLGTTNVEVTAPGSEILDTINTTHLIPKLENGKLSIGAQSSVIMK